MGRASSSLASAEPSRAIGAAFLVARAPGPALLLARALAAALLAAGALAACDGDGDGARPRGDRGFPCYFDSDCLSPLVCEGTPAAPIPVCTGAALEGEPCGPLSPCAWIRDDRGLPLSCGPEGVCAFPPRGQAAP